MRAAFVLGLVSASSALFIALIAGATPPVSRSSGAASGANAHTSSSAGPAQTAAPKGSTEPHPPRVPLWARAPREVETPERNDAHRVVVDRIVAVVGRSVITEP